MSETLDSIKDVRKYKLPEPFATIERIAYQDTGEYAKTFEVITSISKKFHLQEIDGDFPFGKYLIEMGELFGEWLLHNTSGHFITGLLNKLKTDC
jgi:hypothetical protein